MTTSPFDYVRRSFESLESPFLDREIFPREREGNGENGERWEPAEARGDTSGDREVTFGGAELEDRSPAAFEEEVIGQDARVRVPDTLRIPNRWICAIDILTANPKWGTTGEPQYLIKSRATGTLIGPRYVLTAAHVLGNLGRKVSGDVKGVQVSPARNGDNLHGPFGSIASKDVQISQPYRVMRKKTIQGAVRTVPIQQVDDYALIILEKDVHTSTHPKMRGSLGYWGQDPKVAVLKRLGPPEIDGKTIDVTGYPGDTCGTTKFSGAKAQKERRIEDCWRRRNDEWASMQWSGTGTVQADADTTITTVHHTADTYEGDSGAPICLTIDRVLHLVAVHTGAHDAQRNRGVRVTRRMLQELTAWINADAGYTAASIQNDTLVITPKAAVVPVTPEAFGPDAPYETPAGEELEWSEETPSEASEEFGATDERDETTGEFETKFDHEDHATLTFFSSSDHEQHD